jgi:hypothetical protein
MIYKYINVFTTIRNKNPTIYPQIETETPPMMLSTRRIQYEYNLTEEKNL